MYTLAKPCLHCCKIIRQYAKIIYLKGAQVKIRYSTGNKWELSSWIDARYIDNEKMSSGWREKYRK